MDDKDQRRLFCAALHLTNLIEDMKNKKVGEPGRACEKCKYQKECFENNYSIWENIGILTELTGVKFSAIKKDVPVSFIDVVNSNKKCRVEHELVENDIYEKEYHELKEVIGVMTAWYSTEELKRVIREGKWYLE